MKGIFFSVVIVSIKIKICWALPSAFCYLTAIPLGSVSPQTRVEWEQREWQSSEKSAPLVSLKNRQTEDGRCGLSAEIRMEKLAF